MPVEVSNSIEISNSVLMLIGSVGGANLVVLGTFLWKMATRLARIEGILGTHGVLIEGLRDDARAHPRRRLTAELTPTEIGD